ncbi:MAG: UDP-N-acetylglucosamine 4,6-dehydratase (inverting) [Desulfovibrionaceae bacterium]|nr:UDP-N-acetylglucosamine 4,6-dehydratase (inverting) [Desulfovibrionaceae bacterium]
MLNDKSILVTGGTGSFGTEFIRTTLRSYKPKRLIVFSRDELKQYEMSQVFSVQEHPCMRYFIGDVRDADRLRRALRGVDIVVHAAALKQVPTAEYNPAEAVKTNIQGAVNVVDACLDCGVSKCIALSTDKAVNPINLYGATKLCSDKLFIAGNSYSSADQTVFSIVRYGNVMGSRGSVIPLFLKLRGTGRLPVTDLEMTRFWLEITDGIQFVLKSLSMMEGGEIFIPKIPSMRVVDLAKAICPECELDVVGVRPGEKIHEIMIPDAESRNTLEYDTHYAIYPIGRNLDRFVGKDKGKRLPEGFEYRSNTNTWWISKDQLRECVKKLFPTADI